MIPKIIDFLFSGAASKAGAVASTIGLVGSIGGALLWLFGPGREWQVTLNALELSGVALGASVALEWMRRTPPS